MKPNKVKDTRSFWAKGMGYPIPAQPAQMPRRRFKDHIQYDKEEKVWYCDLHETDEVLIGAPRTIDEYRYCFKCTAWQRKPDRIAQVGAGVFVATCVASGPVGWAVLLLKSLSE